MRNQDEDVGQMNPRPSLCCGVTSCSRWVLPLSSADFITHRTSCRLTAQLPAVLRAVSLQGCAFSQDLAVEGQRVGAWRKRSWDV